MSDSISGSGDPSFRDLQAFVSVATTGSFRMAAQRMFTSQPAISRSIGRLERDLGVRLLDRGPRGAVLTPEGTVVLEHSRRIGAQVASLRHDLESERSNVLRLGAAATAAGSYLAPFLAEWIPSHPDVRIEVIEAGSIRLRERLAAGDCDLAIIAMPIPGPYETVTIASPRVRAFFPAGHPLDTGEATIGIADMLDYPILMNSEGFIAGRQFLNAAESIGQFPQVLYRSDVGQTLAALSEAGLGVAVFADSVSLRGYDLRSRIIVDPDGSQLGFVLAAAWPQQSPDWVREFGHALAKHQQQRARPAALA